MAINLPARSAMVDELAARVPEIPAGVGPSARQIAEVVAAIVERFEPEQVVLYGSRAYGVPRTESDVDLMVVMDPPGRLADLLRALRATAAEETGSAPVRVAVAVKLRTPAHIRRALAERGFFIEDVMLKGVRLFGKEQPTPMGDEADGDRVGLRQSTVESARRAEIDLRSARVLMAASDPPVESVSSHARQCAEKHSKALLQERLVPFARTHDLSELAKLAAPVVPPLVAMYVELEPLNAYAVGVRYPDVLQVDVDQEDAETALMVAREVRRLVRADLGLLEVGSA